MVGIDVNIQNCKVLHIMKHKKVLLLIMSISQGKETSSVLFSSIVRKAYLITYSNPSTSVLHTVILELVTE